MAETTTIRLPPKLRARLGSLAKQTGRSAHSLIVEAVERHTEYEEQMRGLVKDALAADRDIEKTGEVYRAEDVHAWMKRHRESWQLRTAGRLLGLEITCSPSPFPGTQCKPDFGAIAGDSSPRMRPLTVLHL